MATRIKRPAPPKPPKPPGGTQYQDYMAGAGHFLASALIRIQKDMDLMPAGEEKHKLENTRKRLEGIMERVLKESK